MRMSAPTSNRIEYNTFNATKQKYPAPLSIMKVKLPNVSLQRKPPNSDSALSSTLST